MVLRWMMVVSMGAWLTGCGQAGPLYLLEEEVVEEEVEVTETVAGDQAAAEAGAETSAETGTVVDVDTTETTVEVEKLADRQPLGPEGRPDGQTGSDLPPPVGPGE